MTITSKMLKPLFLAIGVSAVFLIPACKDIPATCPILEPISINFGDTTAQDFMLSPLEPGKIWVQFWPGEPKVREIDIKTGTQTPLPEKYHTIFGASRNFAICQDDFDSLVWIGGNNCNLLQYNKRTKELNELSLNYVTQILPKQDRVYFVSIKGFFYWDRSKKTIEKEPNIPLEYIQRSSVVSDSTIVLDLKYTFNFNTKQAKQGVYLGRIHLKEPYYSFRAQNDIILQERPNALTLISGKDRTDLPMPYKNLGYTKIYKNYLWQSASQSDSTYFFRYDTKTGDEKRYWYRLPGVNRYSFSYEIDDDYIWVQRPGQFFYISQKDGANYNYPVSENEGFRKAIMDECNVYLLYKDKLLVENKSTFTKKIPVFNPTHYTDELKVFRQFVDSMGVRNDTNQLQALNKFNYILNKYGKSENLEIQQDLSDLENNAFQNVRLEFPHDYESCYTNTDLPIRYRQSCLQELIRGYVEQTAFAKALDYDKKYRILFNEPGKESSGYESDINKLKIYLKTVDSIESLTLSADSIAFFKADALFMVCLTGWFEGEACYHFEIAHDALKAFLKKYPSSALADNAELAIWSTYYCGEGGFDDQTLVEMIDKFKEIKNKYPSGDVGADIDYTIFDLLLQMSEPDPKATRLAGKNFIENYPKDKRSAEIKDVLANQK